MLSGSRHSADQPGEHHCRDHGAGTGTAEDDTTAGSRRPEMPGERSRQRFQNARDLKYNLGLATETAAIVGPAPTRRGRLPWIAAAGVLAVVAAGLAFVHLREKPPETPVVRSTILPPDKNGFRFNLPPYGTLALSPDGQRLLFGMQPADGPARLWVRSLDATAAQPIAGTKGVSLAYPCLVP